MAGKKPKTKRAVFTPINPPDSFKREEMIKAIKKVAAERKRRQKQSVASGY